GWLYANDPLGRIEHILFARAFGKTDAELAPKWATRELGDFYLDQLLAVAARPRSMLVVESGSPPRLRWLPAAPIAFGLDRAPVLLEAGVDAWVALVGADLGAAQVEQTLKGAGPDGADVVIRIVENWEWAVALGLETPLLNHVVKIRLAGATSREIHRSVRAL